MMSHSIQAILLLHHPRHLRGAMQCWLGSRCPIAVAVVLLWGLLFPVWSATVRGRVTDKGSGEPLEGAHVFIERIDKIAVADENGYYALSGVPAGNWTLSASYLGFQNGSLISFVTSDDDTTYFDIVLEQTNLELEEIVFTATRSFQLLESVPVATELVTARDIEGRAAQTAAEALATEVGVEIVQDFSGQGVTLQGIDPDKVLILVDGNRVIGRVNGSIDLDQLAAGSIRQIEVVKGAASTLYGSEAMGGVINIITQPAEDAFNLSVEFSAGGAVPDVGVKPAGMWGFRSRNWSPAVKFGVQRGRWNGSGSFRYADIGLIDLDESTPHTEGIDQTGRFNGDLRLEYEVTPFSRLIFTARHMQEEKLWIEDAGLRSVQVSFDDREENRRSDLSAELLLPHNWRERSSLKLYYAHNKHRWRKLTQGEVVRVKDYSGGEENYAELSISKSVQSGVHLLTAGGDVQGWSLSSRSEMGGVLSAYSSNLTTWDTYLQDEWKPLQGWTFLPGLRYERHPIYGSHFSPRLSAMWGITDHTRMRGSLGYGYRAPTAKELYFDFNHASAGYIVLGNPHLHPEESQNFSLSLEHNYKDRSTARISLFYNDLRNLIDFDSVGSTEEYYLGIYRYQNISSAWTRGIEVERGFRFGDHWELQLAYSFLESRNRQTDSDLIGRAKHSGRWNITYEHDRWSTTLWGQYRHKTLFSSIWETDDRRSEEWTTPYQLWSIAVSYDIGRGWGSYLKLENIFDHTSARYGPRSGRVVSLGARWNYRMEE